MILHVITLMKLHTFIMPEKVFPVRKVNRNPNLEGIRGAKTKLLLKEKQTVKQTKSSIGQIDGTFKFLTWNFNRYLIQIHC